MPRIINTVQLLVLVTWTLFAFSCLALFDRLALQHSVLGNIPFFAKLSLHTAMLTALSSGIILNRAERLARALPYIGLAYCGLLATGLLPANELTGTASPGTVAAFSALFFGVLINTRLQHLSLGFLVFFLFTLVQAVGVVGVAQFILGITDLGNRGLFEALSPSTSLTLLLLAPLLFVHTAFNALSDRARFNQARQDLALALFSLPIGISLLCLIPTLTPGMESNSADVLLLLLALSSILGCWFLYYFGNYAGIKEDETTTKLEQQACQLEGYYENKLEQQAEIAEEQKRFSSVLAHEIRTPLTTVLGLVDILRIKKYAQIQQAGVDEEIKQIATSAQLLRDMINSVLDYAKLKAGQLQLVTEATAPGEMLQEVVKIYQPRAQEKGVNLNCHIAVDLPEYLQLDRIRVREVVSNLIDNALKFTPANGTVRVEAITLKPNDQSMLQIKVVDTGIGIDATQVERIFQPFRQASEGTSREYGGTGLGLSYSRELAIFMGGNLQVESNAGKGSAFTLTVPLDIAEKPAKQATTQQEADAQAQDQPLNLRVLMVEDHPLNAEINRILLESMGVQCVSVESGEGALARYKTANQFDAVLMDINLGRGMSGLDATRKLHERFGRKLAPVFAMTAGTLNDEVELIEQAGMAGIIAKPFDTKVARSKLAMVKK